MEYLLWCEDMDLTPILVLWAGLSLTKKRSVIYGDDLKPYIEDALAELEVRVVF